MKKRAAIAICMVAILIVIGYGVLYRPLIRYGDTHTWATIRITEEVHSETSDVFVHTEEYLQGDKIYFDSAVVLIEDITRDGIVTFSVSDGALYDANNERVTDFVVKHGEGGYYREDYGSVAIIIDRIRYQ